MGKIDVAINFALIQSLYSDYGIKGISELNRKFSGQDNLQSPVAECIGKLPGKKMMIKNSYNAD
jgi:hypothetical protein